MAIDVGLEGPSRTGRGTFEARYEPAGRVKDWTWEGRNIVLSLRSGLSCGSADQIQRCSSAGRHAELIRHEDSVNDFGPGDRRAIGQRGQRKGDSLVRLISGPARTRPRRTRFRRREHIPRDSVGLREPILLIDVVEVLGERDRIGRQIARSARRSRFRALVRPGAWPLNSAPGLKHGEDHAGNTCDERAPQKAR